MPSYTAQEFIDAIPGTGGVLSALADAVGCTWHTAKKYIKRHPTIQRAWDAEKHKITDKARHNLVQQILKGNIQLSKWWVQVMDVEFVPKRQVDLTTKGESLNERITGDQRDRTIASLVAALTTHVHRESDEG